PLNTEPCSYLAPYGGMVCEGELLVHEAHLPPYTHPHDTGLVHVNPFTVEPELHGAAVRVVEASDHPQENRLTGHARPYYRDYLTLIYVKVNILHLKDLTTPQEDEPP